MRIKEEDEQKEVFITHVELFELTIIFFGITNSPAIFQTIINKILRDLVNKSKVAIFINNVLVETKTKKRQ